MKIEHEGSVLRVGDIRELTAVNSNLFRDEVRRSIAKTTTVIEIDLSQTRFVDSSGLGALFTLYRVASEAGGASLRLVNPLPEIQQLFELTQMHQLFEIQQR